MVRRQLGSLLLLTAIGALGACAEQQPPINRVQAYALPKSLFTGEWFFGQTVVDVPGTNTVTMVGNTNYKGMYRIRWDIQQDHLYARKSDELIEGAKNEDTQTGQYKGTIVGAWKILSHFDVKRAYNPQTGEENNVVEENATDCKWYDCKYMRVDWSENLAIDYAFLDSEEGFEKTAMPFYEQDAHDPRWRPIFDATNGYIDVTSSIVVKPASFNWYGWNIPLCWFDENRECAPEVTKIRNSFWRRDPNRDYEPREHAGPYDEWFGYFVAERLTWETHYGVTYKTKKKLINRHNLWDKHHFDTPEAACNASDGDKYCKATFGTGSECDTLMRFHKFDVGKDTDADGLADSFEAIAGSNPESADTDKNNTTDGNEDKVSFTADGTVVQQPNGVRDLEDFWAWDSANMEHRCTIPMDQRDPVPVPYYNTGFFPRSLVCDENRVNGIADVSADKVKGPCAQSWAGPDGFIKPADRDKNASTLHKISLDYDEAYWKTFLRGVFNFSVDDYDKWISTHDINQLPADKQDILRKFGDDQLGYYAFTICPNNPVVETDPWPCRFPHMSFTKAKALIDQGRKFGTLDEAGNEVAPFIRHGDVRYSMVNYVKDYYDGWALLGLGPSMTDPVTGENLAGVANVYALNDWAATNIQEMVQLLNNEISPTDFVNGVNLTQFLKKVQQSDANDMAGVGSARTYSPAEMESMVNAVQKNWAKKIPPAGDRRAMFPILSKDDAGNPLSTRAFKEKLIGAMADKGILQRNGKLRDLSVIAGTPIEKLLVDDDVLQASGFAPNSVKDLTPDVLNQASLARGGFLRQTEAMQRFKNQLMQTRNMDFVGMVDDGLEGLAMRLKGKPTDQVWTIAREMIMRAVLTHEMGHTVGLHHNWSGTDDAVNYADNFWKLRSGGRPSVEVCKNDGSNAATAICPFSIVPMTQEMKYTPGMKSLWEYGYSSVMDYNAKYSNDGNGLGKYDRAAIMYGHVDKVEVFQDIGNVLPPTGGDNVFEEWQASSGNPLWLPPVRGNVAYPLTSYHYTNWYAQMGDKLYKESNRKIVDYRSITMPKEHAFYGTQDLGEYDVGWVYVDPKTGTRMPRVPYAFCSYTHGDLGDNCNTRDFGADQYERMKGDVDSWNTWYIMRSFPRFEYGVNKYSYIDRNYRRYTRLKQYNDSFALNYGWFAQWFDPADVKAFYTDRVNGWGNLTIASHDAFNLAMRTLAMPDVKSFELMFKPDGQKIFTEAEYRVNYKSDISNSRYFAQSWDSARGGPEGCGLMWWECLEHQGFYVDKIMALFNLADPFTNYAGVDTSEDVREWRLGFFENYSSQLVNYFGAILAEDYDGIAPYVDPSKPADDPNFVDSNGVTWINQMAWRDYADPTKDVAKPASGAAVEAATRFTFQVYAAVMGILLFQDNFDNQFVERSHMWKDGNGTTWDVKPVPGKINGTIAFADPYNGSTYRGIDYTDGLGIAQRMIKHANKLMSHTTMCNAAGTAPEIDGACPKPTDPFPVNQYCNKDCMQQKAETQLYQYRQLMDIVIQLCTLYNNNGGAWSWSPYEPDWQ